MNNQSFKFNTKNGQAVYLRYPTPADLEAMTDYVNTLSQEDTHIIFSGEVISHEEEQRYLASVLSSIAQGDQVELLCFIDEKLVGICSVRRHLEHKKRGYHLAVLGLSVAKAAREQGIGKMLAQTTINEAKKQIKGLHIIQLFVHEPNTIAQELYKKLGFQEYGRLPKGILYKGIYYDKIEMYLPLS